MPSGPKSEEINLAIEVLRKSGLPGSRLDDLDAWNAARILRASLERESRPDRLLRGMPINIRLRLGLPLTENQAEEEWEAKRRAHRAARRAAAKQREQQARRDATQGFRQVFGAKPED